MGSYLGISIVSIIIQIALIVHCIRTGRSFLWIWVLLAPAIGIFGAIAYVMVEIIPGLLKSRGVSRAARGVSRALNPEQDLRRFEAQARQTGDIASRQRYAEELVRHDRAGEAVQIYMQTLKGLYEHDANLMLGLARAQFANRAFSDARATLDALIAHNPDFKSPDGHLLYARALEGEGNRAKALEEYAAVAGYYAGAEAKLRYAQLLNTLGKKEDSRRVLNELLEHARIAPRHYRKMQQQWLTDAERELSAL
jgi:hypothetical protein